MSATREQVLTALRNVTDPSTGKDILRLDLVRGLAVSDRRVSMTVVLKDPMSTFASRVEDDVKSAIHEALGSDIDVDVQLDNEMISLGESVQGGGARDSVQPPGVINFIAVASGKGGVGKSTVAANVAVALVEAGYDVGLVDTDMYGPSVPTMFGVEDEKPRVSDQRKIIPLERHGVRLLSMGFLVDPAKAVIWRGPMVTNAVRQFLGETHWGELDFLILDLPPGTGDIQLTIVQSIALNGAVIVSTPQKVALADARKGVSMFESVNVPVLGIAENMAFFTPPELPDKKYYLFGQGGARRLADELSVPFLGEIPIEQRVRETSDEGQPVVLAEPGSAAAQAFRMMARNIVNQVVARNAVLPPTQRVEILHR